MLETDEVLCLTLLDEESAVVPPVSPSRSGRPPSKSLREKQENSTAWPYFFQVTGQAAIPDPIRPIFLAAGIVGDLLRVSPSLREPGCYRD